MTFKSGYVINDFSEYPVGDLGETLFSRDYIIDNYPEMPDHLKYSTLNTLQQNGLLQPVSAGGDWKYVSNGGQYHLAAIKNNGSLWCWGPDNNNQNIYGQLGNGAVTYTLNSPTQIIATGTWKQVYCGQFTTYAIKSDDTLWSWGYNVGGNLGDGTTVDRSSPVQVLGVGAWKQISNSIGIKTDGTLWIWGNMGGSSDPRSSPIQLYAGTVWNKVSSNDGGAGRILSAGIKADGTLWVWGRNDHGQFGNDATLSEGAYRSSPVQTISGGTNWIDVSVSANHIVALKNDGSLWSWGRNNRGQIGDGTTTNRSSPVQTVNFGNNWKKIATWDVTNGSSLNEGFCSGTAALKSDGSLWVWGLNDRGQLGDGTTISRSTPVQVFARGNNSTSNISWTSVSTTANSVVALKDFMSENFFGDYML
jgi:alpha-tubulin suppressor-like RCC1 family protein